MHVVCSVHVNTSNKSISWICSFLSAACGWHTAGFAKEGFKFLPLSCPALAPPEWWPPHFNKPFHRGQFSFLHGVSWVAPSTLITPSSPGSPIGMCSAQRCLLDRAFRGVSVSPWQLLAPCASPSGGWPTARRPLLHTPSSIPRGPSPPSSQPLHLALVETTSSLDRVSDTSLMWRHGSGFNWWLLAAIHSLQTM